VRISVARCIAVVDAVRCAADDDRAPHHGARFLSSAAVGAGDPCGQRDLLFEFRIDARRIRAEIISA
jgi:hypothetical protein